MTPVDNLFLAGLIPAWEVGVFYQPVNTIPLQAAITFGGLDSTKITGPIIIVYVAVRCESRYY